MQPVPMDNELVRLFLRKGTKWSHVPALVIACLYLLS